MEGASDDRETGFGGELEKLRGSKFRDDGLIKSKLFMEKFFGKN